MVRQYKRDSFPGVNITTSDGRVKTADMDDAIGTLDKDVPGIRLWNHRIVLDGDSSIKCEECEMEEEIPELLEMTNGFRQVVYKMYLLGKFKDTSCKVQFETDNSVLNDNTTNVGYTTTTNGSDSVDFQKGGQYRVDVGDGEVITDGTVIYQSTSSKYDVGDLLTHHESLKLQKKWSEKQSRNVNDAAPPHGTSIGGMSTSGGLDTSVGGVDTSSTSSLNIDASDALDEDEKKSLRDKVTNKLGSFV